MLILTHEKNCIAMEQNTFIHDPTHIQHTDIAIIRLNWPQADFVKKVCSQPKNHPSPAKFYTSVACVAVGRRGKHGEGRENFFWNSASNIMQLCAVYCLPLNINCLLFTDCCLLFPTSYLLYTVYCLVFTTNYLLFTFYFSLLTVHYYLFAVHCSLFIVHCSLFTVS